MNLNQGAESTVSYLLSRLTIEKYAFNDSSFGDNEIDELQHHTLTEKTTLKRKPRKLTYFKQLVNMIFY